MRITLVKCLFIGLAISSPCWSAILEVVVLDEERPVSGAKVVIYHEMAPILVQRGLSDSRGKYHFDIEPGPYRIFVLKKGFRAGMGQAMILHVEEKVTVVQELIPEMSLTDKEPKRKLKDILRRFNREPYKEITGDALIDVAFLPQADDSFAGSVRTRSLQDLQGSLSQYSAVAVSTQLGNAVQVNSTMSNEYREAFQNQTQQIQASLTMELSNAALGVEAETIRTPDTPSNDESRRLSLKGNYGTGIKGATMAQFRQSEAGYESHREYSLYQDASYQLAGDPLHHSLRITEWDMDDRTLGRLASVTSSWKNDQSGLFGIRTDMDHFEMAGLETTATRFWLTSEHGDKQDPLQVDSRVGVHSHEQENGFIQHHRLEMSWGPVSIRSNWEQNFSFQSFSSHDIFGAYLPLPFAPYAAQSFYKREKRHAAVMLGLSHGDGWNSRFRWDQADDRGSLLYSHREGSFKERARHRARELAYGLKAERIGASLEISHSQNESENTSFDQTGVVYVQSLNPFRNKGLGLLLELSMSSQPNVPAWWLLEELPWDPREEDTWYEGHLSVQF